MKAILGQGGTTSILPYSSRNHIYEVISVDNNKKRFYGLSSDIAGQAETCPVTREVTRVHNA